MEMETEAKSKNQAQKELTKKAIKPKHGNNTMAPRWIYIIRKWY